MPYASTDDIIGVPPITAAYDAGVNMPQQGLTIKAFDPSLGMGRFMWLTNQTGGSISLGQLASIDERTGATALAVGATRGPLGVSMALLTAGQSGWFQIEGVAMVLSAAAAAAAPAYLNAATGTVINTVVAGQKVDGMIFKTANGTPAAGQAYAQLSQPCATGNG